MQINLNYGKVFESTKDAFINGNDIIIHKGGTGSGKTYEIMMYNAFYEAINTRNEVITVISESMPHLKIGALRYMDKFILNYGLRGKIKVNETDKTYKFPTGTIVEFFSADRIDKALGARRYLLYGNEINSLKLSVWEELARRSRRVIGDFNPTMQFWLEDWLQYYPKSIIIKSNYKDNIALPAHEVERIENRARLDPNFKRIHIDCEYGNADDLVFKPENIILIDEFPKDLKYNYGLDFGWTAPSAMTKSASTTEAVYIDETFYRSGMTEADFAKELSQINKTDKISADSEDQRMINYIYNTLRYNIHAFRKPPGSVAFGVGYLQARKIYITKRSVHTIQEFRNLSYAKDKEGRIIPDKFIGDDHAIDSVRYGLELNIQPKQSYGGATF